MNLKDSITLKNIIILLAVIYAVIWLERLNNSINDSSLVLLEHEKSRIVLQEKIGKLNLKVNYYENKVQNNIDSVDVLDNDALDSLWSAVNP